MRRGHVGCQRLLRILLPARLDALPAVCLLLPTVSRALYCIITLRVQTTTQLACVLVSANNASAASNAHAEVVACGFAISPSGAISRHA